MKKSDGLTYYLSNKMVVFLFIYYFILIFLGGIVSIYIADSLAEFTNQEELLIKTLGGSIAVSGMFCSIQYIKRLYKACLTDRIEENADKIKIIGNLAYFILRPIFAFAFSIIMVYALLSGMFVVTGSLDYILNNKFVYLSILFSSFLGYSIGRLMDVFETLSEEKVSNLKA